MNTIFIGVDLTDAERTELERVIRKCLADIQARRNPPEPYRYFGPNNPYGREYHPDLMQAGVK